MLAFLALIIILVIALLYWLLMSSYSQLFGYFPYKIKTNKKVIALTFDDGPNDPYTSELLDYLKQKKLRATFFLVGKNIKKYPSTVQRIVNEGHLIANHSYSHSFFNYFKSLSFKKEIESNQELIFKQTGLRPALYRPPWLFRTPFILKTLKSNFLTPVSGIFCNSFEVLRISPEKITKSALSHSKPGSIIIFHDGIEGKGGDRNNTIQATKLLIDQLLAKNYKFVTVAELLEIKPYQSLPPKS
jgi:peptidoglycan/xylan/chitin deacetylase (PgdA/CDA1 family)